MRLRRLGPVVELAVVLAMQVHGGDPQAAYLTVVCGAGLAVVLASPVLLRRDSSRITRAVH